MKTKIISKSGIAGKEIELPSWFSDTIREDLCQKYFEISKRIQPYGTDPLAGKRYSASGILKHARHQWKTAYGHGISRVPRKILWRRGDQFYWVGATISSARGGRRAHAPQPIHFMTVGRMNKKEAERALKSALASTGQEKCILTRYNSLQGRKLNVKLPVVIESDALKLKAKDLLNLLGNAFKEFSDVVFQEKIKRAGKGKRRKGQFKTTAGLLLIIGKEENVNVSGIATKKVNEIEMKDVYPLGRLAAFTEKAIEELKNLGSKTK
jgi:ribosomal protein L4